MFLIAYLHEQPSGKHQGLLMDTEAIFLKLQAAGVFLLFVDGQLAVKEECIKGVPETALAMLTASRDQIKLLFLKQEMHDVKPYIDEHYNMGQGGKGCLVIPMNCAERYKYWRPGFSCIPVESDDWLRINKTLKEGDKLKWKPLTLFRILTELGASEELMKRYRSTV